MPNSDTNSPVFLSIFSNNRWPFQLRLRNESRKVELARRIDMCFLRTWACVTRRNGHVNVWDKVGSTIARLKNPSIIIYWTPFILLSIVIIKQSVHIKYTKSTQRQKRLVIVSKKFPIKFLPFLSFILFLFLSTVTRISFFFVHDKVSLIWH